MLNPLRTTRIEENTGRWALSVEIHKTMETLRGGWSAIIGIDRFFGTFVLIPLELGTEQISIDGDIPGDDSSVRLITDLLSTALAAEGYLEPFTVLPGHGHKVTRSVLQ